MTQLEQKEENAIQITENYRVTADIRNIILQEKYEKKESRGKNAVGSGIFDFKDIGYYGNMEALGNALIHKEVIKSLSEIDKLEDIIAHIDKVQKEVIEHLDKHITIDLGEPTKKGKTMVKGMEISEG